MSDLSKELEMIGIIDDVDGVDGGDDGGDDGDDGGFRQFFFSSQASDSKQRCSCSKSMPNLS